MIKFQQVSLQRGNNLLLEHTDLTLHSGWKVGLVGANGAGKSSLFKLLLGELHSDGGELQLPGGIRIAHMAQEVPSSEQSALQYVLDGDQQLRLIQQQLQQAEEQNNHHKMGELHALLDNHNGYSAEARAAQLLAGLGFSHQEINQPVSSFSGGWRIRLNLAQALMCPSDLLLLDEPTNHLDLDATIWLEQWLRLYPGMLILISHDRDFLDNVVSHITHVEHRKLNLYKGGYSAFELQRGERLAQQQSAFEKQQQRISEIENFVRRFKAKATKAKQAQSRLKELERMEKIAPAHVDSPFSFRFMSADKVSTPLMTLADSDCGYDHVKPTLKDISLSLIPGARIGLLGPNGAGKSTLIKTLIDELPLLAGERHCGENLKIGYFAQHQLEALDLDASPLLHIKRISPKASEQQVRDYLGSFGFIGDRALEAISSFSGGEKARVALSLIAWQRPNLLLMDEPTNHLDLEVRHALTLALQSFEGALVIVSHDRHLLRNTVDEFYLVAHQQVQPFKGDLDDYQNWLLEQKREAQRIEADSYSGKTEEKKTVSAAERKEQKRLQAERRNQLRPLKKRLEALEKKLDKLHLLQSEIEEKLSDTSLYDDANKEQLKQLLQQQAETAQQVLTTEEEWLEQHDQLEQLESQLADETAG